MTLHSKYSFSSSHRWLADRCPASIRMQHGKADEGNEAARIGTAAHKLGELCLLMGFEPVELAGESIDDIIVDHQMIDAVEVYVGHVRANRPNFKLEQRVGILLEGRNDVFGTADCVAKSERTLFVDDYKHGYGVVEVENNTQLICYAVASLDTYGLWSEIDQVVTTIIQPRAGHSDGIIRSFTYSIEQLLKWREFIVHSINTADRTDLPPVAGKWCKYCLAAPTCKARMIQTLNIAFDDTVVSDQQLITIYPEIEAVKNHLDAIAAKVEKLALSGESVDGYKLVKARKRAKCNDEPALIADCTEAGVDTDKLYERKLLPKTKLAKVAGKEIANKHFVSEDAGLTLVPVTDNRPAVSNNTATGIFNGVV